MLALTLKPCVTSLWTKLGIPDTTPDSAALDRSLIDDILELLASERVDYTIFWRRLSHSDAGADPQAVRDLFINQTGIEAWLLRYSSITSNTNLRLAVDLMLKTNPKFVLRNHLGEQAIQKAKLKDFSQVDILLMLLESPYEEHAEFDAHAGFPPDWASNIEISCSS